MITIVGVGAMASLFAARLGQHVPVCMLGSWVDAVSAINADGITLETAAGEKVVRPSTLRHASRQGGLSIRGGVHATTTPEECIGSQFTLVLVKSWQTGRAAQQIKSFLAPDGVALTLQNGIGNFETLSAELGPDRAALGVTTQGATLIAPGRVREGGRGAIHVGAHPRIQSLVDLLIAADFETHVAPDVTSLAWGKLAVNAAINALTALLRVPNGELLERPSALALMDEAAREAAAVAAAKGIALPFPDPVARAREVAQATAQNRSSMFQDILRGAPTEIEAINGAVVCEARALGVNVPVNETLYRLVNALNHE